MPRCASVVALLLLLALFTGCSDLRANGNQTPDVVAADCDDALWQHVYKPARLVVVSQCTVASGVVTNPRADDDGDMHADLILDPGQASMINKRNVKKHHGALVIEIVCAVQPKAPKSAIEACKGYHATVAMPAAGTHVRVTGTHVNDTHNGWLEIHPVSKIEILK